MIKKNLFANFVGQGWRILLQMVFIPVYIKYLGMEAYGLIGFYIMLQAWFVILDMGISTTTSREMALSKSGAHSSHSIRDLLRTIEIIGYGISLVIVLSIINASDWIVNDWLKFETLPLEEVKDVFIFIGAIIALHNIEGIYRGSLIGLQRQVALNLINIISGTLRGLGAALIIIYISPTIYAFFLWQLFMSLIHVFLLAVFTYINLERIERLARFSFKAFMNVWRFAGGVFLISIISMMNLQIDKVVVSKYVSLSEFGAYTLAVTMAWLVLVFVKPVKQAFYPKLVEYHTKSDSYNFNISFHKASQIITLLVSVVSIMMIFFSENFLILWLQDPQLVNDIKYVMIILIVGNLCNAFGHMPMQALLAFGSPAYVVIVGSITSLITVILIIYLVPIYGILGAASVWTTVSFCSLVIAPYFIFKKALIGQIYEWYVQDLIVPFFVVFITIGGAKFISNYFFLMNIYTESLFVIILTILSISLGAFFSSRLRNHLITNVRALNKRIKSFKLYGKN